MAIKVIDSILYGSTSKYKGDVYVHENIDGLSRISNYCVPVVSAYINRSWDYYGPAVDGEMTRDLSLFTTAEKTLLPRAYQFRNGDYFYSNPIKTTVVSSPDHKYYRMYEYCISTGVETYVEFEVWDNVYGIIPSKCGIYDDRKMLFKARYPEDNEISSPWREYTGVFVVDFSAGTCTRLFRYVSYECDPVDEFIFTQHNPNMGYMNIIKDGDTTYVVISTVLTIFDWSNEPNTEFSYFVQVVYNSSTGVTAKNTKILMDPIIAVDTDYDYYTLNCTPRIYGSKLLSVISTDSGEFTDGIIVVTADYKTGLVDRCTYFDEPTSSPYVENCAVDMVNGYFYLNVWGWGEKINTTRSFGLVQYDIADDSIATIRTVLMSLDGYGYSFIAGNTKVYVQEDYTGHVFDPLTNTNLYDTLVYGYDSNYNKSLCGQYDDEGERIWCFKASTATLIGLNMTDGTNKEVILSGYSSLSEDRLYCFGDCFLLTQTESPRETYLFKRV